MNIRNRVEKLDRITFGAPQAPARIRVVVNVAGAQASLTGSRCTRQLQRGLLTEIVEMNGDAEGVNEVDLERWIEAFPIEKLSNSKARIIPIRAPLGIG